MTADEVIDLRKLWKQWSFSHPSVGGVELPEATVLAEHDWLTYVKAMTAMVPQSEEIVWPTELDVKWAWPDGVVVVGAEPLELAHTIISKDTMSWNGRTVLQPVEPHQEKQTMRALAILPARPVRSQTPEGTPGPEFAAAPVLYIGEEPGDLVSAWWMPGVSMMANTQVGVISESTRFLMSAISALGHRLTRIEPPVIAGRGERRRVARELPSLRVLQLSSGTSARPDEKREPGKVDWSHRWYVKAHWRPQPYGPKSRLRKIIWIEEQIRGPEDKPLDMRATLYRTGHKVPDAR